MAFDFSLFYNSSSIGLFMNSAENQKEKIRLRYKGYAEDELFCIPAKEQKSVFHSSNLINVAAYARVSTDGINQTSSYELQRNYYTDYINKNENWKFVGIYADTSPAWVSIIGSAVIEPPPYSGATQAARSSKRECR